MLDWTGQTEKFTAAGQVAMGSGEYAAESVDRWTGNAARTLYTNLISYCGAGLPCAVVNNVVH